ncbi:hypothetical protein MMC25_003625 [Agyrium rufum]|nr:hypothetical protein [Agyrium rufum]
MTEYPVADMAHMQLSPDDPYLSYYDIRLMKEDIDCLKNDWLTDNCIAFWEEFLEHEYLSKYPEQNHIVLLRPTMAFMLMQTADPSTLAEALPNFSRTNYIFLPINDCRNVEVAEGGSHWSLLLVSIPDRTAFHYDSLNPSNASSANLATQQLSKLLRVSLRFMNLEDSPQQENGSDCGVFVCVEMKHLLLKRILGIGQTSKLRKASAEKQQQGPDISMGGRDVDANAGRREILKVIEGFRVEGERRRS